MYNDHVRRVTRKRARVTVSLLSPSLLVQLKKYCSSVSGNWQDMRERGKSGAEGKGGMVRESVEQREREGSVGETGMGSKN